MTLFLNRSSVAVSGKLQSKGKQAPQATPTIAQQRAFNNFQRQLVVPQACERACVCMCVQVCVHVCWQSRHEQLCNGANRDLVESKIP